MKTYASREAKNHFGSVIDDAQREPVTITRQGRPVAVVLSLKDYEASRIDIRERLTESVRKIRQEAAENGLTEEALSQILNDK